MQENKQSRCSNHRKQKRLILNNRSENCVHSNKNLIYFIYIYHHCGMDFISINGRLPHFYVTQRLILKCIEK